MLNKFDGCLIVSDVDGTLCTDNYYISDENRKAIEYFKSNGGLFTLSSGRNLVNLTEIGKTICNAEYLISNNGVIIGNEKGIKQAFTYSEKQINAVKELAKLEYTDIELISDDGIYVFNENEYTQLHKSLVSDKFFKLNDLEHLPKKIYMTACWMATEKIEQFKKDINTLGVTEWLSGFRGYRHTYEFVPKEANKGNAASALKKILGARTLITVGDSENDISMLESADISFAPKNAMETVKKTAKYKLESSAAESIFPEVIEKLKKII